MIITRKISLHLQKMLIAVSRDEELVIPEEHKQIVRKRIKKSLLSD